MLQVAVRTCITGVLLSVGLMAADVASGQTPIDDVSTALAEMHRWVGTNANGLAWRSYLQSDVLEAELAKRGAADATVVDRVLRQYSSGAYGLDRSRFVVVRNALRAWLGELRYGRMENLPNVVQAAKAEFVPMNPNRIQLAKSKLTQDVEALNRLLTAAGERKEIGWKAYLRWDELMQQLDAQDGLDVNVLQGIVSRFRGDAAGLEIPEFVATRESLLSLIEVVYFSSSPDLKYDYEKRLGELADQLTTYAESPSHETASAIGHVLGWLTSMDQSPDLVAGVRQHFRNPNAMARVSAGFIAKVFEDDVNDTRQVTDRILGTDVFGTATTQGKISVDLVPSSDNVVMDIRFRGTTNSNNVGYQAGVTLYSTGVTEVDAHKRILIDEKGLKGTPAVVQAATETTVNGIVGPPVRRWIAQSRVAQSKGQAEAIVSHKAERQFAQRMDAQSRDALAQANTRYRDDFLSPLVRRRAYPELLKFSSTTEALYVHGLKANRFQVGAASGPPHLFRKNDVTVSVHESFISNFSEAALGNDQLTDVKLAELVQELLAKVPEELQPGPDKDPWSITFASERPVSAEFSGGTVKLAVRGNRFTRGNQEIRRAMEIAATYGIELDDHGAKLIRQGDVDARYLRGGRESVSQIAFKTFVRKKFEALFGAEIRFDGVELPGRLDRVGRLYARRFESDQGWLTIGWDVGERRAAQTDRLSAATTLTTQASVP